ncbi:tRNA (N(6)-L-threonylcarbamoyladenosine(37)-C(2))-methylthiotransferase MtaB [[Clostridium] fimetarium]|uniref:Threonylcarbamoyladenosine tRNA methylthiotransferase MtaB n=1 Tax=[Clostridium] fimetarium TaxID=99656 RepID=A0A1I0N6W4_9FIRM|nr:tRNA (N(6)-L-threonylcarbamoyladenosine(37)-C(2))-methylthiotransferase MtaB [[Clostridium] fimetarium]SEV96792.1 threonylcarbamoyladenosine tRNA methylthiotransferase MtaB [[Clostridium] fimetarium]
MKKVALHNLGCKVNSYETEAMEQLLIGAGYEIVKFDEEADIYIVNTCSVTNIADRKSRQMLHKAKKLNLNAIVIATGCYVQAEGSELQLDDAVDIVIGNNKKADLLHIIEEYENNNAENSAIIDINRTEEYEDLSINSVCEHTRAYIKIQDGCNQFCSYCIIPYTRGRVRSRNPELIVKEVKGLVDKGYKEIVLTGIHLSSYGIDLGNTNLLELIILLHPIEGLERIRLGSLEPRIITEEFASSIAKLEKVCPHFHLSLQSGCDATLKRMNRRYDTTEYYEKCELLRKYYVHPAITTDVIVGFPGETDEEFAITRAFLEKVNFYEMNIFKYSRRKGTVADKMSGQVLNQIKTLRSKALLELVDVMSNEFNRYYEGKYVEVLFEDVNNFEGIEYAIGHTKEYIKVFVNLNDILLNRNYLSKEEIINGINTVEVVKILEKNTVLGKI